MSRKEKSMRLITEISDLVNDVFDVDPGVFAGKFPYSKSTKIFNQMKNKIKDFDLGKYRGDIDWRLYRMAKTFKKNLLKEVDTYVQQENLTQNAYGVPTRQFAMETERLIKQMRKYEVGYKNALRSMVNYVKANYS